MTKAYEEALHLLNVWDRTTPVAESIAQQIIALFSSGETDALLIARAVAREFAPIGNIKRDDASSAEDARS